MKLTIESIRNLATDGTLSQEVCDYVQDEWENYDDKVAIFTDVLRYGCQSGMVGSLIYYSDTVPFYERHKDEINQMLCQELFECGTNNPKDLFGDKWDEEDPLALDTYNKNLLAWFGFEETMHSIGRNFGDLKDKI